MPQNIKQRQFKCVMDIFHLIVFAHAKQLYYNAGAIKKVEYGGGIILVSTPFLCVLTDSVCRRCNIGYNLGYN